MTVNTPAHAHTMSTPEMVGTAPDTSDGCTKMDAPMMVPTTIAVARPTPMARTRPECGGDSAGDGARRGAVECKQRSWLRTTGPATTCPRRLSQHYGCPRGIMR